MKNTLIILIMSLFAMRSNAQTGNDTIWLSCNDMGGYETGERVYPRNFTPSIVTNILRDNNVYLCLLQGEQKDSLLVVANLTLEDFSVGGPFKDVPKSLLIAKYKSKCKDAVFFDDEKACFGESDCAPYDFEIHSKKDTLLYLKYANSSSYEFYSATIREPLFSFRKISVGQNIANSVLSIYIPKNILEGINVIRFRSFKSYLFWGNREESSREIRVDYFIKDGIITKYEIWNIR